MHHFSWKVSHGPSIGRFNRLDEGFDQPCMNPEAPDPPPEAAAGPSKEQEKGRLHLSRGIILSYDKGRKQVCSK